MPFVVSWRKEGQKGGMGSKVNITGDKKTYRPIRGIRNSKTIGTRIENRKYLGQKSTKSSNKMNHSLLIIRESTENIIQ